MTPATQIGLIEAYGVSGLIFLILGCYIIIDTEWRREPLIEPIVGAAGIASVLFAIALFLLAAGVDLSHLL